MEIGREIQTVRRQKYIIGEVQRDMQYAVFQGAQTGIGRNAELQTGETDFEDQQKRRKEEEQQPKIGPGDDQRAAGWHQALNERSHDARPIEPTQRPNPDSN